MTKSQTRTRLAGAAVLGAAGLAAVATAGASMAPGPHVATRRARRAGNAGARPGVLAPVGGAPKETSTIAGLLRNAYDGTAQAVTFDLNTSYRRQLQDPSSAASVPTTSQPPAPTSSGSADPVTAAPVVSGPAAASAPAVTPAPTSSPSPAPDASPSPSGTSVSGVSAGSGEPAPPPGFSASQLVFNDSFSGGSLDTSKWNPYMTSKAANGYAWFAGPNDGSSIGASSYLDYDDPSQLQVGNGLSIVAQQGSTHSGFSWTSGVMTTYGHFELDGGYVQVRAKMPTADGDWPAIWMLPGPGASTSTDNYEIDLFEGGMTGGGAGSTIDSYHVHQNNTTQWGGDYNTGVDLGSGYHTYGLDWVPGQSVTWYFDGRQIAQVTSAQFPIANEPMELIINNGIANGSTAAWHTQVDGSTGSSSTMDISSVQVYQ